MQPERPNPKDRGAFPILFSVHFGIENPEEATWFDVRLTRDTEVFIDPFLVAFCEEPELQGGDTDIYEHFRRLFTVLAHNRNAHVIPALQFPEADEVGLGYVTSGHRGAGTGEHFAREMRDAMVHAIRAGVESPRHFEEIGLLREGLGKDRISDISARILLPRLAAYTYRVCTAIGLETRRQRLWTYTVDTHGLPQPTAMVRSLPLNPFTRRPIVLVPRSILRRLPTISPPGFTDFLWEVHAEDLRREFNIKVKKDVGRPILKIANANLQWVREYVAYEEERGPRPYDFRTDPSGYVLPTRLGYLLGRALTAPPPVRAAEDVLEFVRVLGRHYKGHIENQRGYELLWNAGFTRHRAEGIAQRLFQAMARGLCDQNAITMAKETNAGTGPVDFLFASGYTATVLLELKHVSNSRFWDGPAAQLPDYLRAQDAKTAMFLAIGYRDKEVRSQRFTELGRRVAEAASATGFRIDSLAVDARPRPLPASRLRRPPSRNRPAPARSPQA